MENKNISYMDEIIYTDINIDFESTNEKLFEQLAKFYILHESTSKWHIGDYYDSNIDVTNINELEKLKEYYVECFSYIDSVKIKKLTPKDEEKLTQLEYRQYLKENKIQYLNSKIANLTLEEQLKLNPFLQKLMTITRILSNIKVRLINKDVPENVEKRPVIFVLSHVGKFDQIIFNELIKEHYTILSGDYESLHNRIEGTITNLNGVIYFDMNSKEERQEITNKVSDKLKSGDNILCSMEGTWNLTPNVLVNHLFPGMIKAAYDANALILPVAIERFNSKLYSISVCNHYFDPNSYFENIEYNKENIEKLGEQIRQELADMKFQTYFDPYINKKIVTTRDEIGDYNKYNKEFKDDILKGWTFTEEIVKQKGYIDKNNPSIVFQYIVETYIEKLADKNIIDNPLKYAETINQLKRDMNDPVYPQEIREQLINIYNNQINNINNEIKK